MTEWLNNLADTFTRCFIDGDQWKWLLEGLGNTMIITVFALLIGIVIGLVIAAVRSTYDMNGAAMKKKGGPSYVLLKIANWICSLFLTVIRGTPVVVQLMIMYFIILVNITNGVLVAVIAFGINSGAYVAEIFRSGIQAVDKGQTEAARSLGLNSRQTMFRIILPQAIKNILPALGNEFITIIKETSLASTFFVGELMTACLKVRGNTFLAMECMMIVGVIYFVITFILSKLLGVFERRLKAND